MRARALGTSYAPRRIEQAMCDYLHDAAHFGQTAEGALFADQNSPVT
jgi:hypothetical protein